MIYFPDGAPRRSNDPFPLTPALSLRERENRSRRVGEFGALGLFERRPAWLPLPEGEGWGEGEETVRLSAGFELRLESRKSYKHMM